MISAKERFFAVSVLSLALIGCGGGSSSTPTTVATNTVVTPPTVAALSQQDPGALVKSAVDAGNSSAQFSSTTGTFATANSDITVKSVSEKAVQSYDCAVTPELRSVCAGQVSLDTNLPATGSRAGIPAGSYLNMSFSGFRPLNVAASEAMTGSISMTFVDAFNSSSVLNGTAIIKLNTTLPKPEVHTDVAMTFRQLAVTGFGSDLTLNGGASMIETGKPSVDVSFAAWRTLASRPQLGSRATISSAGEVVAIQVVGLSSTQTSFDVTVSAGGVAKPAKRVTQDIVNGLATYKSL
jgi:hypothetical protein